MKKQQTPAAPAEGRTITRDIKILLLQVIQRNYFTSEEKSILFNFLHPRKTEAANFNYKIWIEEIKLTCKVAPHRVICEEWSNTEGQSERIPGEIKSGIIKALKSGIFDRDNTEKISNFLFVKTEITAKKMCDIWKKMDENY